LHRIDLVREAKGWMTVRFCRTIQSRQVFGRTTGGRLGSTQGITDSRAFIAGFFLLTFAQQWFVERVTCVLDGICPGGNMCILDCKSETRYWNTAKVEA
jgi:hypothetical protein